MKKILAIVFLLSVSLTAQSSNTLPMSYESVTFTASSTGFTSTTLTVAGKQATVCIGVLETAQIRFRYDGTAPTSSEGTPLEIGQSIELKGFTVLTQFRGIRTGGTSGVIKFTCSR